MYKLSYFINIKFKKMHSNGDLKERLQKDMKKFSGLIDKFIILTLDMTFGYIHTLKLTKLYI